MQGKVPYNSDVLKPIVENLGLVGERDSNSLISVTHVSIIKEKLLPFLVSLPPSPLAALAALAALGRVLTTSPPLAALGRVLTTSPPLAPSGFGALGSSPWGGGVGERGQKVTGYPSDFQYATKGGPMAKVSYIEIRTFLTI